MTTSDHESNGAQRQYTTVAIILHWVIAALILGQIAGGLYMERVENQAQKFELFQLHKSFGLTIMLLSFARLGWRLSHAAPALPAAMKDWERRVARLTHWAFYGLMIGVPIGGWAMVSASPYAESVPTFIFGVVPWPHMPFFSGVEDREALTGLISEMHKIGAFATLGLFVLHVGAAIKHHVKDKDDVLASMAPIFRRR